MKAKAGQPEDLQNTSPEVNLVKRSNLISKLKGVLRKELLEKP